MNNKEYYKEYYQENKARICAVNAEWRKKNYAHYRERRKLYLKERKAKNKEVIQKKEKQSRLLRQYNISLEQFDEMVASRNGMCDICGKKMAEPFIDHCHRHNIVRGLLCEECNFGIGLFQDSPYVILSAILYLRKYNKPCAKTENITAIHA